MCTICFILVELLESTDWCVMYIPYGVIICNSYLFNCIILNTNKSNIMPNPQKDTNREEHLIINNNNKVIFIVYWYYYYIYICFLLL